MRYLPYLTLILWPLCIAIIGCGGHDGNEPSIRLQTSGTKSVPRTGLSGNTYRSAKFFKVSNLPVDGWTTIGRDNPNDIEELDAEKLEIWDKEIVAAGFGEDVALLRHLKQARSPLGETQLLLQATEDNFQSNHRDAIEHNIPFIYISMEAQHQVVTREAAEFIPVYLDQKKSHIVESSTGTVETEEFLTGHWLKLTQSKDRGKVAYTFYDRKKQKKLEIFRLLYWAPMNRYDEFLPLYERIAASFALNIL